MKNKKLIFNKFKNSFISFKTILDINLIKNNIKTKRSKLIDIYNIKKSNLSDYYKSKRINFNTFINDLDHKKSQIDLVEVSKIPIYWFERIQDYIENKVTTRQEDVLLKRSPFWAKSITWSLIGGSFFGIGWLAIAKTEEIIIVQGKLEPIKQVIEIKLPAGGITKTVLISEGDRVKQGQLLVTMDQEVSQSQIESTNKLIEINNAIYEKLKMLQVEGAVSEVQVLEQKSKLIKLQNNFIEKKVNLKYQQIKSPIDGYVFNLQPSGEGVVIQRSEPIMTIVPIDNLKATVEIDSTKIGFVKVGKPVDISIDSYPATDFGVITGEVKSIGSDALPPSPNEGKGYRFPGVINLDKQSMTLKNGQKLPLQAGMSLTANIKLRKVSYLQLLLGTFSNKAESLRSL